MSIKLSVVICTHNPRRDYLERTLNALRAQTLPKEQWELLLVDNAGNPPLAGTYNPRSHEELIQLLKSDLPPLDSKAALMYFA